ncbi:MAG: resolvase domain-containing protein [bacterium]|nr:MAG: resolvase domain-containing protein [bacterium]
MRPKSEWVPVELPEHLRIIDRSQWERVQQHISNNRSLSKRNSKLFYLLKGLVRCGGCQGTYVGDSCHGKPYYRCHKHCKAYPTITQHILEETVLQAVTTALLNPELILDQVKVLLKENNTSQEKIEKQQQDISASLVQIEQEESRILEAYRLGAITASQLGQEMEKINNRKSLLLEKREQFLQTQQTPSVEVAEKSITDYCQQVTQKLESLTDEEKQKLLNLLIEKVIFKGEQIEVRAIIPLKQAFSENKNAMEILFNKDIEQNDQNLLKDSFSIDTLETNQQRNSLSREQSSIGNMGTIYCVLNPTQSNLLVRHCIVPEGSKGYCGCNVTYTMDIKVDYCIDKSQVKGFVLSIKHPVGLKPLPYLGDHKAILEQFLLKQPNSTLQDLCQHIKQQAKIEISVASMHRVVQKLALPYSPYNRHR